jgi:dipeptidyl-peptidase-4
MKNEELSGTAGAQGRCLAILLAGFALLSLPAAAEEKPLDLQTIFASDTFSPQLPRALQWLPGEDRYAQLQSAKDGDVIVIFDPSGEEAQRLSLSGLPADFEVTDFRFHPESGSVLLQGPVTVDWQGYASAPWYRYDSRRQRVAPLGEAGQRLQLVKLSPRGRHAGYVWENNLYLVDLDTGAQVPVTRDGDQDIFNGVFDYGSTEFGWVDGWRWSPDGGRIAYWRMDATAVKRYPLIDELHSYSEVRDFHYPNTGEAHAINEIRVYDIESGDSRSMEVGHDPDDYLPQMHWDTRGGMLYIQHLTRDHKTLRLWRADPDSGNAEVLLTDRDPAWIDIGEDLTPLSSGALIWSSEKSGWRHLYRIGADGAAQPLTKGDWSIDAVVGVDEAGGWVYFYAKRDSLIDRHVYRVAVDGGPVERLSDKPGWHSWNLSPNGDFALAMHSDARTPPGIGVRRGDGTLLHTLVAQSVPAFEDYAMSHTEFVSFETDDGISLNGFFIKPPDFDPDRRYPVIAYGYGNAGSQVVVNRWGTQRGVQQDLWHRYLAQQGYVIFAMDNRTTTGRGKTAKNLTYGEYGKYAVLDYVQGVDYLKSLPWIDSERIGFWGWSGGGYLAAALMTKAAPLFKVAVSVAPVIDLTRYQAVGVERWMGTPEENPEGYAAVNLVNFADRLQGKLLLIHGTGDENVKFAFTLQFADALIRANKQFDMLVYPNQRHSIADYQLHVFSTMTRYFDEHL